MEFFVQCLISCCNDNFSCKKNHPSSFVQLQKCQYTSTLAVVNVTRWAILPRKDEESMKKAIALIGKLVVSLP